MRVSYLSQIQELIESFLHQVKLQELEYWTLSKNQKALILKTRRQTKMMPLLVLKINFRIQTTTRMIQRRTRWTADLCKAALWRISKNE